MAFEWNEQKRAQTYDKHGVDLPEAALIFEGPTQAERDHPPHFHMAHRTQRV